MQKHFAVVTGIAMLTVAGIVVSQQNSDFSLKGFVTTNRSQSNNVIDARNGVACSNPRNCVAGYIGGCDAITCTQQYNYGTCEYNTNRCFVRDVECEDQSLCRPLSSSNSSEGTGMFSSSSSASVDTCGGTCESVGLCCDGAGECNMCGSSSSATMCTGAGEVDCGYGVCCSSNDGYCDAGACVPYMMSSSYSANPESCDGPDYSPPSCGNENNPPPFSTCAPGFHIVDQGCQEGTCGCSESSTGPKIRCQHTFVCQRI